MVIEHAKHIIFNRRKPIDGLRGILSILVVLFHFHIPFFSQGYLGVDSFFVISGFVITSIIFIELKNNNSFSYIRFYSKRFKRLFPSSCLVLLLSCIIYSYIASSKAIKKNQLSFISGISYWENIYQITVNNDYFSRALQPSPVMHYWSLSVEEQYYIFWPLFLVYFSFLLHYNIIKMICILCLSILFLLYIQLTFISLSTSFIYFGTIFRIYQLLSGSIISFIVFLGVKQHLYIGCILSYFSFILLLLFSTSIISLHSTYIGIISTILSCFIIISFEFNNNSYLSIFLSSSICQYFGRLSYDIYLWHFPVIIFSDMYSVSSLSSFNFFNILGKFCVITILAHISHSISQYISKYNISHIKVIIIALFLTLLSVILIIFVTQIAIKSNDTSLHSFNKINDNINENYSDSIDNTDLNTEIEIDNTDFNNNIDIDNRNKNNFTNINNTYESISPTPSISPSTIILPDINIFYAGDGNENDYFSREKYGDSVNFVPFIGDSYADEWTSVISYLSKQRNTIIQIYWVSTCPFLRDIDSHHVDSFEHGDCSFLNTIIDRVAKQNPKFIVIFNRSLVSHKYRYNTNDDWIYPLENGWSDIIRSGITSSLSTVKNTTNIVLVQPHLNAGKDITPCLDRKDLSNCKFPVYEDPAMFEIRRIYEDFANTYNNIFSINYDNFVCANYQCNALVDGVIQFRDWAHISHEYAIKVQDDFNKLLDPFFQ